MPVRNTCQLVPRQNPRCFTVYSRQGQVQTFAGTAVGGKECLLSDLHPLYIVLIQPNFYISIAILLI